MKRASTKSGGRFPGGGGPGREARRERPNGGWRGRTPAPPVVKWSHAEAMKKKPRVRGGAVAVGDGGGWRREVDAEKAGLDGGSCGGRGFGMSPVAETKQACPCGSSGGGEGGDVGGNEVEEEMYSWRWTEAVSPEMLALILRGRVPADEIARGPAAVCRAWREAAASPDMWGEVDIEAWCRRVNCRVRADAAVRRLAARAQGTLRRLSVYRIGDGALAYVASSHQ
uniref:Uncharacterized protein n=1 Tax=Avena sativa TaxID=4498 RepID=A0ACD5UBQ1_AVESA